MVDPMSLQEPPSPEPVSAEEHLGWRLLWLVLIWMLISVTQTLLFVATLVQFVLMVVNKGRPNAQLAWFGQSLGDWLAKAVKYQTAAGDEKPWPWTPLDP